MTSVLQSFSLRLRRVEATGAIETAKRARSLAGQVFRFGVAEGRCERDPTGDIRDALKPSPSKHHAAIVDPKGYRQADG